MRQSEGKLSPPSLGVFVAVFHTLPTCMPSPIYACAVRLLPPTLPPQSAQFASHDTHGVRPLLSREKRGILLMIPNSCRASQNFCIGILEMFAETAMCGRPAPALRQQIHSPCPFLPDFPCRDGPIALLHLWVPERKCSTAFTS
ncbi:hypothetical protein DL89DRAFT_16776 [Linderina pennispora]|uniref:Uncharacterized protein n=1 Tax=Linderina pennispora TaxID=61395 RepID=A0A1Y1WMG0_9FUNG|nr:uncharacterized protein DL89DRAFT_16776 [Linderina pennispora]ORX74468.1 hypothetical protein DL89DRAFT_16776 [Linderina pennispora]